MKNVGLWERMAVTLAIAGISVTIGLASGIKDHGISTVLACGATLLLIYLAAKFKAMKPRDLGFSASGLLAPILTFAALILFGLAIDFFKTSLESGIIWGTVLVCCLVGFSEELLYRGYLQTEAAASLGFPKGLLLASILFGLFHLPHNVIINRQSGAALMAQVCIQFLIGVAMGLIYHKAGNILTPAASHALLNSLALINA